MEAHVFSLVHSLESLVAGFLPLVLVAAVLAALLVTFRRFAGSRKDGVRLDRHLSRLDATVRGFSDVVMVIDLKGAIRYANPAAESVLGYPLSILLRREITSILFAADQPTLQRLVEVAGGSASLPSEFELCLRHNDGTWRNLEATTAGLLSKHPQDGIVLTLRDVTEKKKARLRLSHQAMHDPVTGLPNRTLFMGRLEGALEATKQTQGLVAVMFLDLDRFKLINDTLGHAVGDHLLIATAQRLAHNLPIDSLLARFGGDEFAVLLEQIPDSATGSEIAARLTAALQQPLQLAGHEVVVTASVGVAIDTTNSAHSSDLLRNADIALYQAKRAGGGMYLTFDHEMNRLTAERLDLESDLRRAVEGQEFELYYQPDIDLASGQLSGAEALIRWHHPNRGLCSPAEFIPLAEETGLIVPIGEWVLRTACAQARAWNGLSGGRQFIVSVNLSARQFEQTDLSERVAEVLSSPGINPAWIKLEITESVLMQDTTTTLRCLASLRELGVHLAIDDFGTGYSSFSYLRQFPVDTVKIDQSFVREIGNDPAAGAIVQAITRIAHVLKMDVTAEGIETRAQLEYLRKASCDRGQGFYFFKPLPAREITKMLSTGAMNWIATAEDQERSQRLDVEATKRPRLDPADPTNSGSLAMPDRVN